MEGMLDNPRNILLWITSESTSSESQNSLFVELHHTSIICLTSRSIKLMIEALFCSGNYVFGFAQLLQILVSISKAALSFELTPRPGQRLCAVAAAASPPATDCLSPLPAPDTAPQGATWQQHQLYARSAPPAFLLQKSLGHQMVACMTRITF